MPAPWEMKYGPYWEAELGRKEVQRSALGMPEKAPSQTAAELYGIEQARLGEKRQYMGQAITNWQNQQTINAARQAASQKTAGQAISGAGNLAIYGYKGGKALGLWGGAKPATATTISGGFESTGPMETGLTTAGQGMAESYPGGGMAGEALPGGYGEEVISSFAPEAALPTGEVPSAVPGAITETPAIFESTLAPSIGFETGASTLGMEGVSSAVAGAEALAPAITETTLEAIPIAAEGIGAAIEAGTTAATTAATTAIEAGATAATTGTTLGTTWGTASWLGPVGWAAGLVLTAASLIFGDELSELFG